MNRLIILLAISMTVCAQTAQRAVTAYDLGALRRASSLVLSPNGKHLAMVVSQADFEESTWNNNLWLAATADTGARALTHYRTKVTEVKWSPDGTYLSFIDSGRVTGTEKEKEAKAQLWLLPLNGGEARQLTNLKTDIMAYDWMRDGSGIYFLAEAPEQPELKQAKKAQSEKKIDAIEIDKDRKIKQVWKIALSGGEPERVFDGDFGVDEIRLAPDGKKLLYRTNYTGKIDDGKKFDYWLYDFGAAATRQLTKRPGEESGARWAPNSKAIAMLAPYNTGLSFSQSDLFTVEVATGAPTNLTEGFDHNIYQIEWTSEGGRLFLVASEGVHDHVFSMPARGGKPQRHTSDDRVYAEIQLGPDGTSAFALAGDGTQAFEVYRLDLKSGAARRLTDLNPQASTLAFSRPYTTRWQSSDGLEIEGIVLPPYGFKNNERYPMITIPHGGPFWRNRNLLTDLDEAQVYAANGYAVFLPNFRGSDGYGHEFGIANWKDIGYGDFQDLMTGIDHLIATGLADAEKLGIVGGSYGGYMTNWAIGHSDRFKAAVSMYGIFSLITDFSNSNIPSWDPEYVGDFYWNDLEAYVRHSPMNSVDKINTPVLIIHGKEDPNTFISNSKELYTALQMLGRTVEFVVLPREEHGFREPNHQIDVMHRCLDWFDRYLKNVGYDRAAAFAVGEQVVGRDLTATVRAVTSNAKYAGQKANGRFIEIALELAPCNGQNKIALQVPDDVMLIDHNGKQFAAVGVPLTSGEHRSLSRGSITLSADFTTSTNGSVLPISMTFDVPGDATGLKLRVKDLAMIAVE